MSQRHFSRRIGNFFEVFGSAIAVSAAVEGGREPRARDLRNLGIDPEQFRRTAR